MAPHSDGRQSMESIRSSLLIERLSSPEARTHHTSRRQYQVKTGEVHADLQEAPPPQKKLQGTSRPNSAYSGTVPPAAAKAYGRPYSARSGTDEQAATWPHRMISNYNSFRPKKPVVLGGGFRMEVTRASFTSPRRRAQSASAGQRKVIPKAFPLGFSSLHEPPIRPPPALIAPQQDPHLGNRAAVFSHSPPIDPYVKDLWAEQVKKGAERQSLRSARPSTASRASSSKPLDRSNGRASSASRERFTSTTIRSMHSARPGSQPSTVVGHATPEGLIAWPASGDSKWIYTRFGAKQVARIVKPPEVPDLFVGRPASAPAAAVARISPRSDDQPKSPLPRVIGSKPPSPRSSVPDVSKSLSLKIGSKSINPRSDSQPSSPLTRVSLGTVKEEARPKGADLDQDHERVGVRMEPEEEEGGSLGVPRESRSGIMGARQGVRIESQEEERGAWGSPSESRSGGKGADDIAPNEDPSTNDDGQAERGYFTEERSGQPSSIIEDDDMRGTEREHTRGIREEDADGAEGVERVPGAMFHAADDAAESRVRMESEEGEEAGTALYGRQQHEEGGSASMYSRQGYEEVGAMQMGLSMLESTLNPVMEEDEEEMDDGPDGLHDSRRSRSRSRSGTGGISSKHMSSFGQDPESREGGGIQGGIPEVEPEHEPELPGRMPDMMIEQDDEVVVDDDGEGLDGLDYHSESGKSSSQWESDPPSPTKRPFSARPQKSARPMSAHPTSASRAQGAAPGDMGAISEVEEELPGQDMALEIEQDTGPSLEDGMVSNLDI